RLFQFNSKHIDTIRALRVDRVDRTDLSNLYDRGCRGGLVTTKSISTVPLHSPDFYAGDPYPAYRELRATSPVCWNDVTNFWALLKYEDVRYVSSSPSTFTSTQGITIPDPAFP